MRARFWREVGFSVTEAGKVGDWLVVLTIMVAVAAGALWQLL